MKQLPLCLPPHLFGAKGIEDTISSYRGSLSSASNQNRRKSVSENHSRDRRDGPGASMLTKFGRERCPSFESWTQKYNIW